MRQPPVRVVLVDHQPVFARGLAMLLPALTDSRIQVVASTHDASTAPQLVRAHSPDLTLVDLDLPAPGGVGAIAAIRRTHEQASVLAMSDLSDGDAGTDRVIAALDAGAGGYLHKTGEPEDLVPPLLAATEGWVVLPRQVVRRMLNGRGHAPRADVHLTDEEREVWRLLAAGWTTAQIAARMHVSERTTKRLTAALLRHIGVHSRVEAAHLAGKVGLVDD